MISAIALPGFKPYKEKVLVSLEISKLEYPPSPCFNPSHHKLTDTPLLIRAGRGGAQHPFFKAGAQPSIALQALAAYRILRAGWALQHAAPPGIRHADAGSLQSSLDAQGKSIQPGVRLALLQLGAGTASSTPPPPGG